MSLAVADIRERFEAFADTTAWPNGRIQLKLDEAERRISWDYLGDRADDAHGYLTAHLLEVSSSQRGGGVQNVSAGPISVSYFAGFGERGLNATAYGREFQEIVKLAGPGAMVLE